MLLEFKDGKCQQLEYTRKDLTTWSNKNVTFLLCPIFCNSDNTYLFYYNVYIFSYLRIYANGASGGKGYENFVQSKADQIRALVKLTKGEQLFILVGQMGVSGCKENMVSAHKN